MDKVTEVLEQHQRELDKYKPITVQKHLDVRCDVGSLLCSDPNEINEDEMTTDNKENYIKALTRDNVQLLVNEIWELPTELVEECIVGKLPAPTTVLPRLRKLPGPKVLTKWEKFAKEKGIKKKVKDKKVFDTELNKWVPTYGFKRADAEKTKEWVLEVPKTAGPTDDMFQKKIDLRNERVAKNEIQRMKNIVRVQKVNVPRSGYLGPEAASSTQLLTAATIAKASTASVGKFQEKLPKDKVARGIGVKELVPGSKRKASHITDEPEKEKNLGLIKSVLNKKPKINVETAISLQKQDNRLEREKAAAEGGTVKKGKSKKGRKKSNGKSRGHSGKKPKGAKGQRAKGKNFAPGRKRR